MLQQVAATSAKPVWEKNLQNQRVRFKNKKNVGQQLGGMVTHQLKFQKLKNSTFDSEFFLVPKHEKFNEKISYPF